MKIGDNNTLREGVALHRSSMAGQATQVGDGNFRMAYSHIAHDCIIGSETVIANNVCLAGHVTIEDRAFISGEVVIHQFCRIGSLSMTGGNAEVT